MNLPRGRFFAPAEMACKDGTPYPETWALRLAILFGELDTVREAWGEALAIISGYRTLEYNRSKGSKDTSQHPLGRAADIRPVKRTPGDIERLHALILDLIARGKLPAVGGVGIYDDFVHLDIRPRIPSGHIARWDERTKKTEETS